MPLKTITKICVFVIVSAVGVWGCTSCSGNWPFDRDAIISASSDQDFSDPRIPGTIEDNRIKESSGLASSMCSEGVLWTHNDSGGGPLIFAVGTDAKVLGRWKVERAASIDWEDIASAKRNDGKCELFIGDIGDNELTRSYISVYKVDEPKAVPDENGSGSGVYASEIRLLYPDGPHNAETLLIHPKTRDIYILTKTRDGPAGIYRIRRNEWEPEIGKIAVRLTKIGGLSLPAFPVGFLTGGDIASNGQRVVICDYFNAYEYTLPKQAKAFDEVWKVTPKIIDVGTREQGEAVAYSPGTDSILLTSESKSGNSPLIEVRRK